MRSHSIARVSVRCQILVSNHALHSYNVYCAHCRYILSDECPHCEQSQVWGLDECSFCYRSLLRRLFYDGLYTGR
jgi:hypothetical protein